MSQSSAGALSGPGPGPGDAEVPAPPALAAAEAPGDAALAPLALERARYVGPLVLLGIAVAVVLSPAMGIAAPPVVLAANAVILSALALLVVLLRRRAIPARWGHAALAAVWVAPVAATVTSMAVTSLSLLELPLLLEIGGVAFMLSTRWTLGCLLALDLAWLPLVLVDHVQTATLHVVVLAAAQLYALAFQHALLTWVRRTEALRARHEDAARALADQLADLRRSEADRDRLAEQLLHAQRMETAGTLAAGLAHDMNNILGSIQSFAELLLHDERDAAGSQRASDLRQILAQAERGAQLTRGLLAFSRRGQYRKQVVGVDDALGRLVPLLARMLPKAITLDTRLAAGGARIDGDPTQLDQVIVNLALNAADAIAGNGTITIASREVALDEAAARALGVPAGAYVRVDVADTGSGMDEDTRRRVFEPFFTTKPLGRGTGLGLSTVWGVVQGHGGAVDVTSTVGVGTTFTLHLPLVTRAAPARAARDNATSVVIPVERPIAILVVDDEAAVRAGTARLLQRKGFAVLQASNGAEALAVYDANAEDIGLVVLDMGMPVMGGAECFARLRERSHVPVLIATGYTADEQAQSLTAQGAALIEKPFAAAELSRAVKHLLGRATTPSDRLPITRREAMTN